jgi:hypothetical protein
MMNNMWQTKDDLKSEILAYIKRLEVAESEIHRLPTNFVEYKEYKKRQAKKSQLNAEILTVRQIILYAKEAYDEV